MSKLYQLYHKLYANDTRLYDALRNWFDEAKKVFVSGQFNNINSSVIISSMLGRPVSNVFTVLYCFNLFYYIFRYLSAAYALRACTQPDLEKVHDEMRERMNEHLMWSLVSPFNIISYG